MSEEKVYVECDAHMTVGEFIEHLKKFDPNYEINSWGTRVQNLHVGIDKLSKRKVLMVDLEGYVDEEIVREQLKKFEEKRQTNR